MLNLLIVGAIFLAIVLGYRSKINTGFFAIMFAYFIGCFGLGLKPSEVIKMWPIAIFFQIFSVTLFYNVAVLNGTLKKLADRLIYPFREYPIVLPFIVYFIAALISSFGAGAFSVIAFFAPIALILCDMAGIDKLIGAIAVNYGAIGGANLVTSVQGLVFKGLMEQAGYVEQSFQYTGVIFIAGLVHPLILLAVLLFMQRRSIKHMSGKMEKPEPFSKKEKQTLSLIAIMLVLILVVPFVHMFFPENQTMSFISSKIDVSFIAVIFAIIALGLNLADQKSLIAKVPWNTLVMIGGVGMLVQVAVKAGTVDMLASWVSSSIPVICVPLFLCLLGCFMSFFSSTIGVVTPALFPTIPAISAATGWSPMVLFTVIVIGAQASAISPFSSNGSIILGTCSSEQDRNSLFGRMIFEAVPKCFCSAAIACIVLCLLNRAL